MLYADILLDMNVAQPVGTTLTTAILTAGMQGGAAGAPVWGATPNPPTAFSLATHVQPLLDSVTVAGVGVFAPTHAGNAILYNNLLNFRTLQLFLTSFNKRVVSMGGWWNFGMPPVVGTGLYDVAVFSTVTGTTVTMQAVDGQGAGYYLNLETAPSGVTTHSSSIQIVPNVTYWVTVGVDYTLGTAIMSVYATDGTLVGTTTAKHDGGGNVQSILFGQNEGGIGGGGIWFKDILVDWSHGVFPLGPKAADVSFSTTVAATISQVRDFLLEASPRFWSDAELLAIYQLGVNDLWGAILDLHGDHYFVVDTTNVSLLANASQLSGVPANCFRVLLIEPRDTTSSGPGHDVVFTPRRFNHPLFIDARAQSTLNPGSTGQVFYTVSGVGAPINAPTILTAPTLSADLPLRLVYCPTITLGTQNPIPGQSDNALKAWTIAYALGKEGTQGSRSPDAGWLAVYATEKQLILTRLTPRQEQETEFVEDFFHLA